MARVPTDHSFPRRERARVRARSGTRHSFRHLTPFRIDEKPKVSRIRGMSNENAGMSAPLASLNEAIARAMKGLRDPDAERGACERMDRMREEIRQKHGLLDIGVPSIRELRDR